jgi:hypothetical protein
MTDEHHTGGSAYPHDAEWHEGREVWAAEKGMTLRDWFAGQALAGIAATGSSSPYEKDAEQAYRYADAMLVARNRPPSP